MAGEKAHRDKARDNQAFLEQISDDFPDWIAIAAFYTAVHLVEMLAATDGHHSRGHHERNRYLKARYPGIWTHFFALWNYSVQARYDCAKLNEKEDTQTLKETAARS